MPFTNLVIRASAGTGKTFQLSNRYLALMERGVPPDRILATTFTRKAAGEILERIVQRLAAAVQDQDERQSLQSFLGCQRLSRDRCCEMLQDLLRNLHRLRICTLDSLFGQMARATSLEIGLPPGWQIIDELEEQSLRDAAIAAVLRQESTSELLRLAHLLTKGETRRGVGQLVRETVRDLHGLFQETDARAWHSIPQHKPLESAEIATLLAELRQVQFPDKRAAQARDTDYDRALADDWDGFAERGLASKVLAGETTYYGKPLPDEAVRIYRRLLDQVRAVVVNRIALQTAGSFELLHKFDSARRRFQEEHAGLRFDDITHQLDIALGRNERSAITEVDSASAAAASHLSFRLDGQITHLLLDEFQDTSPRQWRVLRPFVERTSRNDGESSFFCVGDVKQAIYGWRGGVAEIFDAIEQHVPQLTRQGLAQSFRSSPAVIETVNQVFRGLQKHPVFDQAAGALDSWRKQFEEHSTARTELAGYACLRTAPLPSDGESPQDAVLNSAAKLIEELISSASGREIGVLVRTNDTVAAMIHALRRRSVRASEEGGNPLTDSAAVQLIVSLLRLADHPGDTVARFHIATSPLAEMSRLTTHDDDKAARRLSTEIRAALLADGYGRAIQRWVDGLHEHIGSRDATRLRQLVEMAYLYQPRATLRADDFIRRLEQKRIADPLRAAVRVMTVHQSKGLEFDIVVLPELDFSLTGQTPPFVTERPQPTAPVSRVCRYANAQVRQLLPRDIQRMFDAYANQELSESLCVLYVALTRAAQAVYMVIAPSKENEKSLPRTFAGLLRASLTNGSQAPAAAVLFEKGDCHWMLASPPADVRQDDGQVESARSTASVPIQLAPTERRRRGLGRVSPSGLEGGASLRLGKGFESGEDLAALRGSVLHAWFQQVAWLEDGLPCDADLRVIAEDVTRGELAAIPIREWLVEFHNMLQTPAIGDQLRRRAYRDQPAGRLTVETERPFAVPDQDGLLTGCIDRVVLLFDGDRVVGAEVIDFKTDQFSENDDVVWQSRVEYYLPQLEAYRRAVAILTSLPPTHISGRLLFVSAGRMADLADTNRLV